MVNIDFSMIFMFSDSWDIMFQSGLSLDNKIVL